MADDSQLEYEDGVDPENQPAAQPRPQAEADGSDLPIKAGAIYGVATFLLGYITVFAATSTSLTTSAVELESTDPSSWKMAIWSFLGHHGVEFQAGGEAEAITSFTFLPSGLLVILLPMALLTAAGYSLAKYAGGDALEDQLKAAALVVPGYLVLSLAATLVAGHNPEEGAEIALATQDAILYAGIIWPAVFGLIGGLLAAWPKPVDRLLAQVE